MVSRGAFILLYRLPAVVTCGKDYTATAIGNYTAFQSITTLLASLLAGFVVSVWINLHFLIKWIICCCYPLYYKNQVLINTF